MILSAVRKTTSLFKLINSVPKGILNASQKRRYQNWTLKSMSAVTVDATVNASAANNIWIIKRKMVVFPAHNCDFSFKSRY